MIDHYIQRRSNEMDKDREKILELQKTFQQCADILGDALKIVDKMENTEDKKEYEKLDNKLEEKLGLFMVQMIKINKFNG